MSPSDPQGSGVDGPPRSFADHIDALSERFTALARGDASEALDLERVRTLMCASIHVFVAARAEHDDLDPIDDGVSPTDVMTTAQALLDHYDLSLFDMAAWSHRELPKGTS